MMILLSYCAWCDLRKREFKRRILVYLFCDTTWCTIKGGTAQPVLACLVESIELLIMRDTFQ